MKITREEVAKVASLSRLNLTDEKLDLFARQFNDILEYMDLLNSAATEGVEPLYSPVEQATPMRTPMREDEPVKRFTRADILSNAPQTDGAFFIVPKIV